MADDLDCKCDVLCLLVAHYHQRLADHFQILGEDLVCLGLANHQLLLFQLQESSLENEDKSYELSWMRSQPLVREKKEGCKE